MDREVSEFEGLDDFINDERGSEPGSQAQEKRSTALVASQCLHGSIIDEFHGTLEGSLKVKADPSWPEVMRFHNRPVFEDRSRIANGYHVIFPILRELLNSGDHLFRRHCRSGRKLPLYAVPSCENL